MIMMSSRCALNRNILGVSLDFKQDLFKLSLNLNITSTYRSITCFSYILMISLDHQNKMVDYLKNWPFYSNDFIRSYEIVRNQKSSDRSKCTNYVSNLPRFGSLLQKRCPDPGPDSAMRAHLSKAFFYFCKASPELSMSTLT